MLEIDILFLFLSVLLSQIKIYQYFVKMYHKTCQFKATDTIETILEEVHCLIIKFTAKFLCF